MSGLAASPYPAGNFHHEESLSHADTHEEATPSEIAVGVIIGRSSEYFDFFVFGIACVLVFPSFVFPFMTRLDGTLMAFAIFALAFVARPVGTAISMAVQRRWGRGTKLTIALFLLGASTAGMAFLPSYNSVGHIAIIALVVLRLGQGLALGGTWDGLPSLLAMSAPQERRGWYAMIGQAWVRRSASRSQPACSPISTATCRCRSSSTGAGASPSSSPSRSTWWRSSPACA